MREYAQAKEEKSKTQNTLRKIKFTYTMVNRGDWL